MVILDSQEETFVRIAGVLYGQAYGDSFGMPSELLRRTEINELFGSIDTLTAGHPSNPYSKHFDKGEVTDDTHLALQLAKAIIENDGVIDPHDIGMNILEWAHEYDVWNKNILGPSTTKALQALEKGVPIDELENQGITNGAAMKISPLGCALPLRCNEAGQCTKQDVDEFIDNVYKACSPTHKSDVAVAGATAVATFISCAVSGLSAERALDISLTLTERAQNRYASTLSPNMASRILWALGVAQSSQDEEEVSELIYSLIGADVYIIESVPAAFAVAQAGGWQPKKTARIAANLGGDTDTIGAIATAICGSLTGVNAIPTKDRELLDKVNGFDLLHTARKLTLIRENTINSWE